MAGLQSNTVPIVVAAVVVVLVAAALLMRSRKKRTRTAAPAAPAPRREAEPAPADASDRTDAAVPIELVKPENVLFGQGIAARDDALSFISREAVRLGIATDADDLMAAFLKREDEGTTGMMDGFAIPHAKCAAVKDVAVIVLKDPSGIEGWSTMDDEPVTVAIALLVPEIQASTVHLRLLSKVAEALMDEDFRATVKRTDDAAAIAKTINDWLT